MYKTHTNNIIYTRIYYYYYYILCIYYYNNTVPPTAKHTRARARAKKYDFPTSASNPSRLAGTVKLLSAGVFYTKYARTIIKPSYKHVRTDLVFFCFLLRVRSPNRFLCNKCVLYFTKRGKKNYRSEEEGKKKKPFGLWKRNPSPLNIHIYIYLLCIYVIYNNIGITISTTFFKFFFSSLDFIVCA